MNVGEGQFQFYKRKLFILKIQDMTFDKFLNIHFDFKRRNYAHTVINFLNCNIMQKMI